jgi:O-antigen ligase
MTRRLGPVLLALLAGIGGFKAIPGVANLPIDATSVVAAITFAALVWVAVTDRLSISKAVLKPLLLLVALSPPVLWSSWSTYSTNKIALLFTVTTLCLVAPMVLVQNRSQLHAFLGSVTAIGLLMAVASLSGFVDPAAARVTAFDASQLHLASFGGALLIIAVSWALSHAPRLPVGLAVAALSLFVVIGSGTRAAVAGAAAALLVVLVAARGQGVRKLIPAAVLVPALGAAFVYGLQVAPEQARHRLEAAVFDLSGDRSAAARLDAWRQSVELMGSHPLGVGIGDWPAHAESNLTYPHNLFLEAGSETGWLGLLAVLFFLVLAFQASWRYSAHIEGQMLLGLLTFLLLQAMSRGDLPSHRLLYTVAAVSLVLPRILSTRTLYCELERPPPGPHQSPDADCEKASLREGVTHTFRTARRVTQH